MKKFNKVTAALIIAGFMSMGANAQTIPTLEMDVSAASPGQGPNVTPVVIPLSLDAINNNIYTTASPALSLTVSLRNQVFTGLPYSNIANGISFGAAPTLSSGGAVQQAQPNNIYDILGAYGNNGGAKSNMFTSNPTAAGAQLGTGMDVDGNNQVFVNGNLTGINGGVELFTAAQVLFNNNTAKDARVLFGELVFTFSRPVKNPVLHFAGLGGSYRFYPAGLPSIPANYKSAFFATELEMVNTGLSSTLLSGNAYISLAGNNILNNAARPNGGSITDPLETPFDNVGAATGSVRVNGTVQQVVYRVYLRGSSFSDINWSAYGLDPVTGAQLITNATRNPLTGDIWYVAASLDKPVQQVSGNVFIDKDGLTDNNVNESAGVANAKTNIAGTLYANLLNNIGQVVASTPISPDGQYLFDNVPVGSYSVQLTRNSSTGTYATPVAAPATALPVSWVNTGENIGSGTGNDGAINGTSLQVTVVAGDIKTEINFGINRLPESVNFNTPVPSPVVGTVYTLNSPLLPVLSGSDPEDKPTTGVLSGNAVRITTIPANATLQYNGVNVTAGQTIANFNPALLKVLITAATIGSTGVQFNYAYVDAAGFADPTPATYIISWAAGGPLPVSFTNLSGVYSNGASQLSWASLSEINFSHYELERSSNGTDFNFVARVAGANTSGTKTDYNYADKLAVSGANYYRLRMIDNDGRFVYSNIVLIKVVLKGIAVTNVYPNPFINKITVVVTSEKVENTAVRLFDNSGKLLYNQNTKVFVGSNEIVINNLVPLAKGNYILEVKLGDTVFTSKLVK